MDIMRYVYWNIDYDNNFVKYLNSLGVNEELINYLSNMIPGIVSEHQVINIIYDESKNNFWNTLWTWYD